MEFKVVVMDEVDTIIDETRARVAESRVHDNPDGITECALRIEFEKPLHPVGGNRMGIEGMVSSILDGAFPKAPAVGTTDTATDNSKAGKKK